MADDAAIRHSPAAERNQQPILEVLKRWLPAQGFALEIASGTGQHAVHFAAGLPGWSWQPSDPHPASLASTAARREAAALANLLPPLPLDVTALPWPIAVPLDALFCANMLHISPWASCEALMRGAAQHLAAEGRLVVYGPFFVDGETPAASNLDFDADLRERNPAWGLRRLAAVEQVADTAGLALRERADMPANNLMLLFSRAAPAAPKPAARAPVPR